MAKTTELRDKERAIVKNLRVIDLSIRLDCCFSPSYDSVRMRVCKKPIKVRIHNALLQYSQNQHRSCFGGSVGRKSLGKRAACDGRTNAEKYMERLQVILFKGTKAMLGKTVSHFSPHMPTQPLTDQYLPKFS